MKPGQKPETAAARQACLRAIQELEASDLPGYGRAIGRVSLGSSGPPDEELLRALHQDLTGVEASTYRRRGEMVYDSTDGDSVYVSPDPSEIPGLVSHLFAWVKEHWDNLPATVLAGVCGQEVALIRAFDTGNEPLGWLLADAVLWRRGYSLAGVLWPEVKLAKNQAAYRTAMRSSHSSVFPTHPDFTPWLEFYAQAVAASADDAVGKLDHLHSESPVEPAEPRANGPVVLRERQRQALERIRHTGSIRSGEYQRLVRVVPDTARRDFADLLAKGLIAVRGVGRGTHYVLTPLGSREAERLRDPA
ncbi:MAG: Fic family protein [Chloroflexota bacterium]